MTNKIVASAPGKVLVSGGYLILEKPNAGIVFTTNARFYAIVKPLYDEIKPDSWSWAWCDVKLTSPQFSREILYKLALNSLNLQSISCSGVRNSFVEYAVQYSVAAARIMFDKEKKDILNKLLLQGLHITILGDNGFYSYRSQIEASGLPLASETLAALPSFTTISFNTNVVDGQISKPEVAKTGLGSSAAMTTAVVAALLHYLGLVDLSAASKDIAFESLDLVHILAQAVHCVAQGKVGSGFDVCSAVYGSQRYVRFSEELLSYVKDEAIGMRLENIVSRIINEKWDHERTPFYLPPLMSLLLGEPGTGGSSTPSMVGAVKKWQKAEPEQSLATWKKLSEANSELEAHLNVLNHLSRDEWNSYKAVIECCSRLNHAKWIVQATEPKREAVVNALIAARKCMFNIRSCMRFIGEASGVPIEPGSQSQLLDDTMDMEGVLVAGIPGAGGFDAVFAITLGDSIAKVRAAWCSRNVLPLLVKEDPRGVSLEAGDPRSNEITSAVSAISIY